MQVGKVRWADAIDLFAYLRQHPATHELVAAYLQYKAPPENMTPDEVRSMPAPDGCLTVEQLKESVRKQAADDPSGIGGLIAMFPSGYVPANR